MYKTFEVVNAYIGNYEIKAYENGRRVLDIILNDYNVDGACEVLEALVGFFGRGEFRLVGPGIGFIVRLLGHSLGAAGAQEGIHRGAVELQDVACHHGNGQKQGKHHGQTAPQVFLLQHFVLL